MMAQLIKTLNKLKEAGFFLMTEIMSTWAYTQRFTELVHDKYSKSSMFVCGHFTHCHNYKVFQPNTQSKLSCRNYS